MNLIIAWRNIWRNKKRTIITISSVILAVNLAVFTRSFQEGTYKNMIDNAVGQFTGFVQVHNKDYWENKNLDNGLLVSDELINKIAKVNRVESVNARIEGFSLAAIKNLTKGTLILGINPDKEDKVMKLKSKIIEGEYIAEMDKSIVLGSRLASFLKITIGDTLVLMGQGHYGQSAINAYPVKGIIKMPSPDIDKQIVLMPLALSQEFFSFPNGATSLVIQIRNSKYSEIVRTQINESIDTTMFKAMEWKEMSPELIQQIEGDKVGGIIMIAILYMIIAFGVFGTVLMMAEERKKEFGVMIAIGMQKYKLAFISIYETFIINTLGLIVGVITTIPIIIYFRENPIRLTAEMAESMEKLGVEPVIPTVLDYNIFANQIIIIIVITSIAAIYPIISILKLNVIKALRK